MTCMWFPSHRNTRRQSKIVTRLGNGFGFPSCPSAPDILLHFTFPLSLHDNHIPIHFSTCIPPAAVVSLLSLYISIFLSFLQPLLCSPYPHLAAYLELQTFQSCPPATTNHHNLQSQQAGELLGVPSRPATFQCRPDEGPRADPRYATRADHHSPPTALIAPSANWPARAPSTSLRLSTERSA